MFHNIRSLILTWSVDMSTEKTTIPDLSDASIIARRYIEAAILKNVFDEITDKFEEKLRRKLLEKHALIRP